MKVPLVLDQACEILLSRVRFQRADLRLPGTEFPAEDTQAIQEATRLYVESWIVPIIQAIQAGDMKLLDRLLR